MSSYKVKFPIKTKLILIISMSFVITLTVIIFITSYFFRRDTETRIKESNHSLSGVIALKVKADFETLQQKAGLIGAALLRSKKSGVGIRNLFDSDKDLLFLGVVGLDKRKQLVVEKKIENKTFMKVNNISASNISHFINSEKKLFQKCMVGSKGVFNASPFFKRPVLSIGMPLLLGPSKLSGRCLVLFVSLNRFLTTVKSPGLTKSFIVNGRGEVLAHYDPKYINTRASFIKLPIVTMMLKSTIDNGQRRYADSKGLFYLGSFKKTGFAGMGVVATIREDKAFEAVTIILRRNILIGVIIVNLVIIVMSMVSKSLTKPISTLMEATEEIRSGNFNVKVKATTKDEIGSLTRAFVQMGQGLEEREKMKDAFGKFVNKEIAEKILNGELKLGGERKNICIFFSDIRSFTAISEKLEPEEVVEFLNQYLTKMVGCVEKTHGVVDKFIGDAIMAVWGTPISRGNDTENAINGALMMRRVLKEFNHGRGSSKSPVIRIGCGINTGPVLAGQIGSLDHMQYTVIGDAVNLASRIEALNKPFGTDILVSQDAYEIVKNIFHTDPMQRIKVKGKTEPQQIYAVLSRKDDANGLKSIDQLREFLGIDTTALPAFDPDAHEDKFEIIREPQPMVYPEELDRSVFGRQDDSKTAAPPIVYPEEYDSRKFGKLNDQAIEVNSSILSEAAVEAQNQIEPAATIILPAQKDKPLKDEFTIDVNVFEDNVYDYDDYQELLSKKSETQGLDHKKDSPGRDKV